MDPAQLDYASRPLKRSWLARTRRWWLGGLLVVTLGAAFLVTDSGPGSRQEVCDLCSACRSVRTLGIFGNDFDLTNTVHKGVICECLEKHSGITCAHKWRGYSWTSGLKRACGDGRGALDARVLDLHGMDKILMNHLASDPTFEARLRQNLVAMEADRRFLEALMNECIAARTTTQASTP